MGGLVRPETSGIDESFKDSQAFFSLTVDETVYDDTQAPISLSDREETELKKLRNQCYRSVEELAQVFFTYYARELANNTLRLHRRPNSNAVDVVDASKRVVHTYKRGEFERYDTAKLLDMQHRRIAMQKLWSDYGRPCSIYGFDRLREQRFESKMRNGNH